LPTFRPPSTTNGPGLICAPARGDDPLDYFKFRYYEKGLGGITGFLIDKGYVSEDELAARAVELWFAFSADDDVLPPPQELPLKADGFIGAALQVGKAWLDGQLPLTMDDVIDQLVECSIESSVSPRRASRRIRDSRLTINVHPTTVHRSGGRLLRQRAGRYPIQSSAAGRRVESSSRHWHTGQRRPM
jgi:hypothetical protein